MGADEKTYTIDVKHVTRVEGHGRIRVNTRKGEVEDVKLCITEAHRFFRVVAKKPLQP